MPKLQTITTNLTAGEWSPRLRGRVDLTEKFNASADKLENCIVLRQGGATIRPSRDFLGEVSNSAHTVRIIPFIFSRVDTYLLEFGDLQLRIWKNGAPVTDPGPFLVATPYTQAQLAALDFTQGADTLILTHPLHPPQRLLRFTDSLWTIDAVPFAPPAVYEAGLRDSAVTLTISNTAVGAGRTITATGGTPFLASDVGRLVGWLGGSALITAFGSTTSVTATVQRVFAGAASTAWLLEGTPNTPNTPGANGPVGASITLTLGAAGWRTSDVGKIAEMNGGLVRIDSFTSTTIVNGTVLRVLDAIVPWRLLSSAWNAFDGYPATCSLFEQRLWFGGTRRFPQTEWGSRPGLFFDFLPGIDDDSAVYKTIDSDDINVLQFLSSATQLVALTYGGEFETRGGVEKPITQLNAQIKKQSKWGCEAVRPEEAGTDLLFVQRGGMAIRALFQRELDGYGTRDISVFSEHLLRMGVAWLSFQQAPEQVLWIGTLDGKLLACTFSSEQTTVAFCSGNAEGIVEWGVTIPEGAADSTYLLVRYTVNGVTKRYIERLNWTAPPGQDSRLQKTVGVATAAWTGYGHLAGKTVCLLADDVHVGSAVVSAGGEITLPRAAFKLSAGLPYAARARLLAPEVGTGSGTAQGQQQSTNHVWVRFLDTIGLVENARSFSSPGGMVRITCRRLKNEIEILVDDDGPGIRADAFEKIFERFYTDRPHQGFGQNSGLGLSISKQIVEAHGGRMWAENRHGVPTHEGAEPLVLGARFIVRLPAM